MEKGNVGLSATVQFKIMHDMIFYSTNGGRSWIERCGEHQAAFELWCKQEGVKTN